MIPADQDPAGNSLMQSLDARYQPLGDVDDTVAPPPSRTWVARRWVGIRRFPSLTLGLIVVAIFVLTAIFAGLLAPFSPNIPDFTTVLQGPTPKHPFGTDDLGRDILTRVMYGARFSLGISGVAVGLATLIGIPLGLIGGYFGGVLDAGIGRVTDALFAFPAILMGMAIAATMGPSVQSTVVALAIIAVPEFSRISRAAMVSQREAQYVEASRALGSPWPFIIFRVILPNTLGALLVLISLGFANAILSGAALTFLGLGAQPPTPEWGAMLSAARDHISDDPWFAFFPGLAITILVFAFNFVGDGIRDVMDPRRIQR